MFLPLPSAKFVLVWFENSPSYLGRKKGISETFLSFGLISHCLGFKTFPQFPFSNLSNLGKTQIRCGQILPQTWREQISKQNTNVLRCDFKEIWRLSLKYQRKSKVIYHGKKSKEKFQKRSFLRIRFLKPFIFFLWKIEILLSLSRFLNYLHTYSRTSLRPRQHLH